MKQNKYLLIFLFVVLSVSLVSSQFGYDNSNLPQLKSTAKPTTFNNNTANVNNSIFWDGNAWSSTRWLDIDGGNANQDIDIGSYIFSAYWIDASYYSITSLNDNVYGSEWLSYSNSNANFQSNNITTSGYYHGDGSQLTGIGGGNPFDQSLNKSDNVTFDNLTLTGYLSLPFTNGSIPFFDGNNLIENNDQLFWDDANEKLQVGKNGQAQDKIGKLDVYVITNSTTGTYLFNVGSNQRQRQFTIKDQEPTVFQLGLLTAGLSFSKDESTEEKWRIESRSDQMNYIQFDEVSADEQMFWNTRTGNKVITTTTSGDFLFQEDSMSVCDGLSDDACRYFNGSDWVYFANVGTPNLYFNGFPKVNIENNLNVDGNLTINRALILDANTTAIACIVGTIYYDGTLNKHMACNGTWNEMY